MTPVMSRGATDGRAERSTQVTDGHLLVWPTEKGFARRLPYLEVHDTKIV